jgi:hypothetical protein
MASNEMDIFERLYKHLKAGIYTGYDYHYGRKFTYDHRSVKTGHPVRSAIHKHKTGRLVLEWVTIWESRLLYVFAFCSQPTCRAAYGEMASMSSSWLHNHGQLIGGGSSLPRLVAAKMLGLICSMAPQYTNIEWKAHGE